MQIKREVLGQRIGTEYLVDQFAVAWTEQHHVMLQIGPQSLEAEIDDKQRHGKPLLAKSFGMLATRIGPQ